MNQQTRTGRERESSASVSVLPKPRGVVVDADWAERVEVALRVREAAQEYLASVVSPKLY